ncbi:MAG: diaminopimelate epimerase [Planctomycetota bacterium]|jgi:diaminopimelate epimerase
MKFTKMHGCGNDYVYVNCFEQKVEEPAKLAQVVSDRHKGIGANGLILICPSQVADVRMRIFNADGSEAEMCGNGIRCVAKYVYEHGICRKKALSIETGAGILSPDLQVEDGRVVRVRVDMGEPILVPKDIPVELPGEKIVEEPIEILGQKLLMTCVSMGNPHAVFFCNDVNAIDLEEIGPVIENHKLFPNRINVHFVKVDKPAEFKMRTWERGSGITMACGTGACAVCVAGVVTGRTERKVVVHLPGGDLDVEWNQADNHIYMTGPAVEVFEGVWPVS